MLGLPAYKSFTKGAQSTSLFKPNRTKPKVTAGKPPKETSLHCSKLQETSQLQC